MQSLSSVFNLFFHLIYYRSHFRIALEIVKNLNNLDFLQKDYLCLCYGQQYSSHAYLEYQSNLLIQSIRLFSFYPYFLCYSLVQTFFSIFIIVFDLPFSNSLLLFFSILLPFELQTVQSMRTNFSIFKRPFSIHPKANHTFLQSS